MYWGHEERKENCTTHVAIKHGAGNDIIDSGLQYIACYHRGSVSQTCSLLYLPGSWYTCADHNFMHLQTYTSTHLITTKCSF